MILKMKLRDFLKDKAVYLIGHSFVLLLILLLLFLFLPEWGGVLCVLTGVLYLAQMVVSLWLEYHGKRKFYQNLIEVFHGLDRKNLIAELVAPPQFSEGILLYELLREANKAYLDEIGRYKNMQEEYREYIELWVHEIKTPIASALLLAQNNKSPLTDSLAEDLERIEGYVQQALFYSRSNNVHKDYIVKEISLQELCVAVLRRHAKLFIEHSVSVETEHLDMTVYCDAKWLEYILVQLLANAVKYAGQSDARITICAAERENSVVLTVADNGIGIAGNELPRIFDKGFTGSNGRKNEKSTGMGLYICKKLCDKLGLTISAESAPGSGTAVHIGFPKNSMTDIV